MRRVVRRGGVCLLVGAEVTVAVSWGFAMWGVTDGTLHGQFARPPVPPGATTPRWGELAPEHLDWPVKAPAGWASPRRVSWAVGWGVRLDTGAMEMHDAGDRAPWHVASGVRSGWPSLAMQWRVAFVANSMSHDLDVPNGVATGVKLSGQPILLAIWYSPSLVERRLPLLPVWPGFAVNTLLYACLAAAVWTLLRALPALRRRRRRRRGLCPECGYAAGGLAVCPECGGAAPALGRPVARTKSAPM